MQTKLLAAIGTAAIVGAALAGCSSNTGPVKGTPAAAPKTASSAPSPVVTTAKAGTRENPFPIGTPGKYLAASYWTFTWKPTNGDAWPVIQKANQFNEAPTSSNSYVLGTVELATGDDSTGQGGGPSASFTVAYVGSDGNTYPDDACGVLPGTELSDVGNMYAHATKEAETCAEVPTSAVKGGTWIVTEQGADEASVFFKGA